MTIEITRPEIETLIHQRLHSGTFHDVNELIAEALDALQEKERAAEPRTYSPQNLQEMFEAVRGLADDVDFRRNSSTGRPIDL